MREIQVDVKLIAYCGLYCGSCKRYLTEKCPGCHDNEKATWCKIRTCCMGKKIASCAECTDFDDPKQCKKFYNFISKVFALVFGSDRPACIKCIKNIGPEAYAKKMADSRHQAIKK